jgi:hypothetical protein
MTDAIQSLLDMFDRLSDTDRQEAAVEMLRRVVPREGELPEDALVESAAALFCALDSGEAASDRPLESRGSCQ